MIIKQILVHSSYKPEIAEKLKTSLQTVNMALKYVNNSPLGISIRNEAKEKLQSEVDNVENHKIEL